MKKIAIIGASYLQKPLVEKAKELGLETHVFAWREGNVVEGLCDYYYPVSILEKDIILEHCKKINIDGIISIASDLAMPTVNYVAEKMGLQGNSLESTILSTDKYEMRKALRKAGLPVPKFEFYNKPGFEASEEFNFPVIVKPTDRSGSRGVTKVGNPEDVNSAILKALGHSISKKAIVEEFVEGQEFSVEFISYEGKHIPLAITAKVTSGAPFYVELEHHQPADIFQKKKSEIFELVKNSLNALKFKNGASHSEIIITPTGELFIIEIGGRMGGDLIGSHLVKLSTGFDFVHATIDVALNDWKADQYQSQPEKLYSGVYYITPPKGKISNIINRCDNSEDIVYHEKLLKEGDVINTLDSSGLRAGCIVYNSNESRPIDNPFYFLEYITE